MKRMATYLFVIALVIITCSAFVSQMVTPLYLEIPKTWPKPHYDFSKNPLSEQGFQLGRKLFYDPILSRDSTISCQSCHLQASGFTHIDHSLSHGIEGRIGTRNSMALVNLAWRKSLMWDGGVNNLEVQPVNPITNPAEMDETLEHVVAKLSRSAEYRSMFADAFGDGAITGQRVLKALTQFEVMLVSDGSKYDHVMRHEDQFTDAEGRGYNLFKTNCASCHAEPLFESEKFEYNGLEPDTTLHDRGRMKITGKAEDDLRFKVPTLRNIQYTYPYMHDGRFKTLAEVIRHYNSGLSHSRLLPKELDKPMNLSDNDRVDLVAFLKTLGDPGFLHDKRFGYPEN